MVYTPPKWILLGLHLFVILHQQTIEAVNVNYNDLVKLNATCRGQDSCQGRTTDDLRFVNCQCGRICAYLGTCCVDSKYRALQTEKRNNRIVPTQVYRNIAVVFMVNDCKPGWVGDKGIKDLCEVSFSDAYFEDPFLLMPVTNITSGMTYKNYYCFSCNEEWSLGSPVIWDLRLYRDEKVNVFQGNISNLRFDQAKLDYTTGIGKTYYSSVGIPEKLHPYVQWYRQTVISTCDDKWTDVSIKEKCSAYTALVQYYKFVDWIAYKNPHCAICNYISVSDLKCSQPDPKALRGGPPYGFLLSGIFSFEDKVSRCPRDEVFDKFFKRCRAYRCGKNQKIVNGKCRRNK